MSEMTDADFVEHMQDLHLKCVAPSFDDGNRLMTIARRCVDSTEVTARLIAERDALASDRDGYVQLLTDENNKLRAQVDTAAEMLREVKARNNTLTARVKELEGALEIMSMMGGYTKLHPDESAPGVEQQTYSWGVSDGYKEMAEMARAVLSASQPAPSALPVLSDEFVRAEMDAMQARENKRLETLFTQPAPQPWRPIETAPKDGTVVLVFAEERQGLPAFQCTAAYHEDAGWCVDELREVTHWMPLPPPPQKENSND